MFEPLRVLPPDAIIGIMAMFRADEDPRKIDLSVGVYQDEQGLTPVLDCVKRAERALMETETTKSYVGIAGNLGFIQGMEQMVFGADHPALAERRVATVQTPGGSGAISVAGHLLQRAKPGTKVHLSDPSWPNHSPLLKLAGLQLASYPYYDSRKHEVAFDAMLDSVRSLPAGDVILLHGCCHNPCGADLTREQWQVLAELCVQTGVVPFVDFAYQGLAEGLEEDAFGARLMAELCPEAVVVTSCSKNFGLYRERVGSVSVVTPKLAERDAVFSNLSNVARGIYSMPPDHGAAIVDGVLRNPELKALWIEEVSGMRDRLNGLRQLLVDKLDERGVDMGFVAKERGMFSFLGLSREQIVRLRDESHVYMVESSRVNVAGISKANVDYVADAIAAVL